MASKDPAQVAQDWATRLAGSTDKIKRGIASVTVAPGQAAARQSGAWLANTTAAKDKFARNVAAVSLADWQNAASTKGADRVGAGASAAQPKMQQFLTKLLPFVDSARQSLPPRGSYEQNKARANAMMDKMHGFSK